MIRSINIIVSNAGQDDGVPTSILRELSYLKALSHENIVRYIACLTTFPLLLLTLPLALSLSVTEVSVKKETV